MNVNESRVNLYGGLFWLAFGLFLYFVLIPDQIADVTQHGVSPRYVPNAVAGLVMLCGFCMAVGGHWGRNKPGQAIYRIGGREITYIAFSLLAIACNIILFHFVGYLAPAMLTIAVLMYGYGNRSYKKIILYSICVPVFIKYFFQFALQMYLP